MSIRYRIYKNCIINNLFNVPNLHSLKIIFTHNIHSYKNYYDIEVELTFNKTNFKKESIDIIGLQIGSDGSLGHNIIEILSCNFSAICGSSLKHFF